MNVYGHVAETVTADLISCAHAGCGHWWSGQSVKFF